jgi:hypothetical protein
MAQSGGGGRAETDVLQIGGADSKGNGGEDSHDE